MTRKRILITGGAGFIGGHLRDLLVPLHDVVTFDAYRHGNGGLVLGEAIKGDIRDAKAVRKATEGCDIVIHCASLAGVDHVLANPVQCMEVSLLGTLNVLRAAAAENVERFVNFSTSEVAGPFAWDVNESAPAQIGPAVEGRWIYAAAKAATEHATMAYYREHLVPALSVRPFNVFGGGQLGQGAVRSFVLAALAGEPLIVRGDGSRLRSWCHISDFCRAVIASLERPEAVGQVINIGTPANTLTVLALAREVVRLTGSRSRIEHAPDLGPDVALRTPDITLARRVLGWEPQIDMEAGLVETIGWYRARAAVKAA